MVFSEIEHSSSNCNSEHVKISLWKKHLEYEVNLNILPSAKGGKVNDEN